jgi:hypothetical protein
LIANTFNVGKVDPTLFTKVINDDLFVCQNLKDFGYNMSKVPLLFDGESAIQMADNPIDYGCTKHIDIVGGLLLYRRSSR